MVFVAFNIMEDEHVLVSLRQLLDGPPKVHTIKRTAESKVRSAMFNERPGFLVALFWIIGID